MFKLAELFVEVKTDLAPFNQAMSHVHSQLHTTSTAVGTFMGNAAMSLARIAGQSSAAIFDSTIRSASHFQETVNKTNVLFEDAAKKVFGFADEMAKLGQSKQEVIDATVKFALLGSEMGKSKAEAVDFGIKLTRLAMDAKSLGDMTTAAEKMRSALAGQSKPLRELGIFATKANMEAEAARVGIGTPGKPLNEGQKIEARVSLIEHSEFMTKAVGDLARTIDQSENATRKFWGTLSNLNTSMGTETIPIWEKFLGVANDTMSALTTHFETNKSTYHSWSQGLATALDLAGLGIRSMGDLWSMLTITIAEVLGNAGAEVSAFATNVTNLAGYIGKNWYKLIVDGLNATGMAFINFGKNAKDFSAAIFNFLKDPTKGFDFKFTSLLDGFKATADALPAYIKPAYISMQKEFDEASDALVNREIQRALPRSASGIMATAAPTGKDVGAEAAKLTNAAEFFKGKEDVHLGGDVQEKQLAELQHIREIEAKSAGNVEKMLARSNMAFFH